MQAVRGRVPGGKWSMGLLGKGTGNSIHGQTRGGGRWVSGYNKVKEENKNLCGIKARGEKKLKNKKQREDWEWDESGAQTKP